MNPLPARSLAGLAVAVTAIATGACAAVTTAQPALSTPLACRAADWVPACEYSTPDGGIDVAHVRAALDALAVKGRAAKTGYSRDRFGDSWSDDVDVAGGHDGCDTRDNVLARDLRNVVFKPGTRNCVVASGTLNDPYTGKTINFTRGGQSAAVQIDHVVPLSLAWQTGAQQLSPGQRTNLANDPRNLFAVDGPANQQKSDSDAASWLPLNKSFRCTYVAAQVEVKALYGLWVTQPEKDAITRQLDQCGGTPR